MSTLTSYRALNVWCPDGVRRRFLVTGQNAQGDYRGYVQVKKTSVTGYVRRRGQEFRFYPIFHGKNLHLVRPQCQPIGKHVRIVSSGRTGTVIDIAWNYLTPTYTIRLDDRRCLPVVVVGLSSVKPN